MVKRLLIEICLWIIFKCFLVLSVSFIRLELLGNRYFNLYFYIKGSDI